MHPSSTSEIMKDDLDKMIRFAAILKSTPSFHWANRHCSYVPAAAVRPRSRAWPRLNKKLSSKRALEEQAALLTHFAEHLAGADRQRRGGTLRAAEEEQWRSRLGEREKSPINTKH